MRPILACSGPLLHCRVPCRNPPPACDHRIGLTTDERRSSLTCQVRLDERDAGTPRRTLDNLRDSFDER